MCLCYHFITVPVLVPTIDKLCSGSTRQKVTVPVPQQCPHEVPEPTRIGLTAELKPSAELEFFFHWFTLFFCNVVDPCHFCVDPEPAIFVIDFQDANKKLTNGSGSCYFCNWLSRRQQKTNKKKFFCLLIFVGTFTSFFKEQKVKKKSRNSRNQGFFLLFLLDDRRIRINTSD